jgi:nitroreductase
MKSETGATTNILDAVIHSRKSVRAFKPDPVPKRLLMEVVDVARAAPSNFNSQPLGIDRSDMAAQARQTGRSALRNQSASVEGKVKMEAPRNLTSTESQVPWLSGNSELRGPAAI